MKEFIIDGSYEGIGSGIERHDTFEYLKDPRLPDKANGFSLFKKDIVVRVGGPAALIATTLFGGNASVIPPEVIAEYLNNSPHTLQVGSPEEIQPLDWESFLPSSDPDPEGLTPEDDEPDPEDSEPGRTAGLSSPPEGGIEGVDYTKQTVDAGDIQPGMKLVAGGGIPARDEQTDGFPFLKDNADNLIILKTEEELEVLEKVGDFVTVRRVDNFTNLPKEERVVALWIGPEGTTTDKKDDQGNPTGHQLWKRQALDGEVPVKDVIEPEVFGEQVKISIDIERLNQIIAEPKKIIGKQPLYEDSGKQHGVSSADGRTEVQVSPSKKARIMFDGEIRILVETLVDGKIYIKKSDGKELIAWIPLRGLADSELSRLSVNELRILGFSVEDNRLETKPQVPLTSEEQAIVNEIAHGGPKIGGRDGERNSEFSDILWLKACHNINHEAFPLSGSEEKARYQKGIFGYVKDVKIEGRKMTLYFSSDVSWNSAEDVGLTETSENLQVVVNIFKLKVGKLNEKDGNKWVERVEIGGWSKADFLGWPIEVILKKDEQGNYPQYSQVANFMGNPNTSSLTITTDNITVY